MYFLPNLYWWIVLISLSSLVAYKFLQAITLDIFYDLMPIPFQVISFFCLEYILKYIYCTLNKIFYWLIYNVIYKYRFMQPMYIEIV